MGNLCLFIFLLLLVVALIVYHRRKKNFDAGAVLISLYAVYALLAIFLFNDYSTVDNEDFQNFKVKLFPLVYLFVGLIIAFYPILSFKSKSYARIQAPAFKLDAFAWFVIVCYVLQAGYIVKNLSRGLFMVLFMDDGTLELYSEMIENQSEGGMGIANVFSIFANMLYPFTILMFYYYLSLPKRKKIILAGLGLAILIGILDYVAKGQRGGMVKRILIFIGTFFLFKDYIADHIKKKIKFWGTLAFSGLVAIFMIMSLSRFGEREGGVLSSFNRYGGEAVINFDKYAMDDNGIRYGDRVVPLFKKILQFDNVPNNFYERRLKYPNLYVNDEVFITFIGDFCIDFGPVFTFFILIFFSIWIRRLTLSNQREYPFHKLILLHFTLCICIQGGSLFPYADTGNLVIIMTILLYLFFSFCYSSKSVAIVKTGNNG